MKRSYVLAGTAVVAAVLAAAATAGSPPTLPGLPKLPGTAAAAGVFLASYHLSGYGVFHETVIWDAKAAPCQVGGKGGGGDGLLRNDTTIRWESVRPATVRVQRLAGHTAMLPQLNPGTNAPGAIATVTVTSKTTDDRQRIACDLAGNPVVSDEPGKQNRTQCGTHTYASGYYMGTAWPNVINHPGERVAAGVVPLPATDKQVSKDWINCYGVIERIDNLDASMINAPLPFADLPRKVRGKLSVIAHGGDVRLDGTEQQNTGGTIYHHDEFHGTSYVTWIRIG